MCTVSYLPLDGDQFILTSNRDEGVTRKSALMPQVYEVKDKKLIFPKDGEAGGTWIGLAETGRLICLMNGAFILHERKLPYRMSRGQVVLDGLTANDLSDFLEQYKLENIEPFTIVVVDWASDLQRWELRWDGVERHIKALPHEPQVWSSATLYNTEMHDKRVQWFGKWLDEHPTFDVNTIRNFHKTAGEGDPITNLRTERGFLRTVSVTTVEKTNHQAQLTYEDLRTEKSGQSAFQFLKTAVS